MRKFLIVFALSPLLMAGMCGTREPPPRIVPVPCVNPSDVPPEVPPVGELPEDARVAADILGLAVLALRANERLLRGLLRGCAR